MTQGQIQLQFDPYVVFRHSTTPPGLYARQKWLDQATDQRWQADFEARVQALYRGRHKQGGWGGSPLKTVRGLFDLHLTVREGAPWIHTSLDRLMQEAFATPLQELGPSPPAQLLYGLPFTASPWPDLLQPAALFLCAIFGRALEAVVLARYDELLERVSAAGLGNETTALVNNLLRALVVHPQYCRHPFTHAVVAWLADHQTPQGDWLPALPFFQTLNALAHLDAPAAHGQTLKAFTWLAAHQRGDGTWGNSDREWNTFLALHALRNKEIPSDSMDHPAH
ncbi:MAG: hypothetical protein WBG37_09120 [Desulfobacterales bacterium]